MIISYTELRLLAYEANLKNKIFYNKMLELPLMKKDKELNSKQKYP